MHLELATGQQRLADAVFFSCGPDAREAASQCLWLASTPSSTGCTKNRQSSAAIRAIFVPFWLLHRPCTASLSLILTVQHGELSFRLQRGCLNWQQLRNMQQKHMVEAADVRIPGFLYDKAAIASLCHDVQCLSHVLCPDHQEPRSKARWPTCASLKRSVKAWKRGMPTMLKKPIYSSECTHVTICFQVCSNKDSNRVLITVRGVQSDREFYAYSF